MRNFVLFLFVILIFCIKIDVFSQKTSTDIVLDNNALLPNEKYLRFCDSSLLYSFQPKKAEGYIKKAYEMAKDNNFDIGWKLQMAKAWAYFYEAKYDSAENYMNGVAENFDFQDTSRNPIILLNHLGYLNYNLLRYSEADSWYKKLLDLAIERSNTDDITKAYWGLIRVAESTEDYLLASRYFEELFVYHKNENTYSKAISLQKYAENAIKLADYQSALVSLNQAKSIFIKINDSVRIYNVYNQLGWVYNSLNMADSSIVNYEKSLTNKLHKRERLSADTYGNLGIIYVNQKDYGKAIVNFKRVLKIALEIGSLQLEGFGYYHLSNTYDSIGDYKNAYLFSKKFSQLNDSARKTEIENIYIQERTKFETEKKEKELEILALKYNKNRIILYSSLSLTVLILLVAFLLFRQNQLKTKHRLTEYKRQIAETKQTYLRQQMNPHFVFNTLNSIQYYMFRNDKMATNIYMSKFAMLIRIALENSQHNSVPIKHELDALQLYIELEQLRFKNSFSFNIDVDEEIDVLQHKIPTLLIQPFVENSINHGLHFRTENGKLLVVLKLIDNMRIECTIEDNGIGRKKAEEIKKVKRKDHHSLGTSITKERLNIIDSFVAKKLKIEYFDLLDDNNKPTGTRVVIDIPILI